MHLGPNALVTRSLFDIANDYQFTSMKKLNNIMYSDLSTLHVEARSLVFFIYRFEVRRISLSSLSIFRMHVFSLHFAGTSSKSLNLIIRFHK